MVDWETRDDAENRVSIRPGLSIPMSELQFRFSRSGGPGGQHVNTSATRVELLFDVAGSPSLEEPLRDRLMRRLSPYIDQGGILRLVSQSSRSQTRNREEVVERFQSLLAGALKERRKRRPTRPSRAAREKRLESKRRRSQVKRWRKPPGM
jgi:ribosome-associated protein